MFALAGVTPRARCAGIICQSPFVFCPWHGPDTTEPVFFTFLGFLRATYHISRSIAERDKREKVIYACFDRDLSVSLRRETGTAGEDHPWFFFFFMGGGRRPTLHRGSGVLFCNVVRCFSIPWMSPPFLSRGFQDHGVFEVRAFLQPIARGKKQKTNGTKEV